MEPCFLSEPGTRDPTITAQNATVGRTREGEEIPIYPLHIHQCLQLAEYNWEVYRHDDLCEKRAKQIVGKTIRSWIRQQMTEHELWRNKKV